MNAVSNTRKRLRVRATIKVLSIVVVLTSAVWLIRAWSAGSADDMVLEARRVLANGDVEEAHDLACRALRRSPNFAPALVIAGDTATKLGRPDEALRFYNRIEDDAGLDTIVGLGAAGNLLLSQGRLIEAETRFRAVLRHNPRQVAANRRLSTLLTIEGRRWESGPYLYELLRQQQFTIVELVLLGNPEELFDDTNFLERSRKTLPDDPLPLLGFARMAFHRGETVHAAELLREVVAVYPAQIEAQALLGRLLLESGSPAEIDRWHAQLPVEADSHPDVWFVRGSVAEKSGQSTAAVRCYWETLLRNPNHQKANYRLSQLLLAREQGELAGPFLSRSRQLEELAEILHRILFTETTVELMTKAAQLTESLGRLWEAWAWHYAVAFHHPGQLRAQQQRDRLKNQLRNDLPQTVASANPVLRVDFSSYPLPYWDHRQSPHESETARAPSESHIAFVDDAPSTGLNFSFYNGINPEVSGIGIYQNMGGGIAVLDFNGDGWPDLYFVQACDWPPQKEQRRHLNRLFLNLGNSRFRDVTALAGVGDNGFGEGVTVGDFDDDGFPDLYVANIGRNRLFRNNGDGTFSDLTEQSGLHERRWTTSCLLADINGDGFPDIYDVNYLSGTEPFEKICRSKSGLLIRSCKPNLFEAEQDQLFLNLGNGTFQDVTSAAGIVRPDGKGLGIVAADLEGSGQLSLLVANDSTANFLFKNRAKHFGDFPSFSDRAAVSGWAFDGDGQRQACMGVAAGDANGDGRLDLFVTNFYNDANTLYLQRQGGYFVDGTRKAGLREPSIDMLGFGTQFLDAELDGWPDLVIANGHIDDFTHENIPWKMPPQFFHNQGNGHFTELTANSLGRYFQRTYMGRSLVRVDWNRDGKEDFVVSHLDAPAALLTNKTGNAGHFLAVRLGGVKSNRDAIGTVVSVTVGTRTRVMQMTAGDGFFASNQRQLVFGLGQKDRVAEMHVRWPSGLEQTFQDVPADVELQIIEGKPRFFLLPQP